MQRPRVSVVMPTYNYGRFLGNAIDSWLGQTFADFELIVVDDGSTDQTPDVVASYDDERIVSIRREENSASAVWARNDGMAVARGEFVAVADSDDTSVPDRLASQVQFLDDNADVDILGGALLPVDVSGQPVAAPVYKPVFRNRPEKYRYELMRENTIYSHSSLMFRRKILNRLGGYHFYAACGDYEFMLRATRYFTFCNLKKILVHVRLHTGSTTITFGEKMKKYYRHIIMAQEFLWVSRQLKK